ncbi:hypothetical protein JonanDRAFT_0015 [Jonquetella anthropi DSM 22815]|uniref:Arginine dihydrolase ArgZ/ArgE-like C-terminal second subdomain domain-containing protein n=2 Tax=Dethiosulfovibrionaceae TaxID=3029088 RepID=H0ULI7_9BACT|nr:hypothetical protein [Jonquetella anthropi]EHM12452.1 hypothetical protein JonanDRAFT_0015 [Jonquetella anthropi DSM 22815]
MNMEFRYPEYRLPDFGALAGAPEAATSPAPRDGVAPRGFFLTSHLPTYYLVEGRWVMPDRSFQDAAAVVDRGGVVVKEVCDLKAGDRVVTGDSVRGEEGILIWKEGFGPEAWRTPGLSVESALSGDYAFLAALMNQIKSEGVPIVWVLGPSVVFDSDTREALSALAKAGYINGLLAGNALATHDLEGGYLGTALGQDIYTQKSAPMGHYNHLDLLNDVRSAGSISRFIAQGNVKNGLIRTLVELNVPFVLAGSVRDDGPLPEVHARVTESLRAMKGLTDRAGLIIGLATMLHSVAAADLASGYRKDADGRVRPVYFAAVDVTENVDGKVASAREGLAVETFVTNVQDFVVNLRRALTPTNGEAASC